MASIDGGVPPESSFPLAGDNTGGHPASGTVGEFNPSDVTLPTVTFNPVSGNSRTPSNTVAVDVVDTPQGGLGSGLRRVVILVVYADGTAEIAYSGTAFVSPYSAGSSTSSITNGTRYTLQRSGDGWLDDFQLRVYVTDTSGNEPSSQPSTADYTVPTGVGTTDVTAPDVAFSTSGGDDNVTTGETVRVDITDDFGIGDVTIWAEYTVNSVTELVYAAAADLGLYTVTPSSITDGTRYSIVRGGSGWLEAFTLHVRVIDTSGNVTTTTHSYTVISGVGAADTAASTIEFDPTASELTVIDTVAVEITDNFDIADVTIWAEYTGANILELVYAGGSQQSPYVVVPTGSSPNIRYDITRGDAGWLEDFTLHVQTVDGSGNSANDTEDYTVPAGVGAGGGADTTGPTVTFVSPPEGTDITPDTELVVDVQDETSLALIILLVTFGGYPHTEAIYNGSAFLAPYAGGGSTPSSTVEVIAPNTHLRFHLRRFGGWPGPVSLYLAPVDRGGNLPEA